MCDKRLVNIMREKINKCPALKVAYLRMFIQPLAAFTQFIENVLFTPASFKMLFMFMYHFNRHPGLAGIQEHTGDDDMDPASSAG